MAGHNQGGHEESDKEDNSDSDFDDDEIMAKLREQRINDIKEEQKEHQLNMQRGHGTYSEIVEDEFLPAVTKTKFVIVHFYHKDFERCKIMDHHL